jgi:hypothetical protein
MLAGTRAWATALRWGGAASTTVAAVKALGVLASSLWRGCDFGFTAGNLLAAFLLFLFDGLAGEQLGFLVFLGSEVVLFVLEFVFFSTLTNRGAELGAVSIFVFFFAFFIAVGVFGESRHLGLFLVDFLVLDVTAFDDEASVLTFIGSRRLRG